MDDKPVLKRYQIAKLTVSSLKERLSAFGLSTTGKKDELVTRLFNYQKENESGSMDTDEGDLPGGSDSDAHGSLSDREDVARPGHIDDKAGMSDDEMVRLGAQQAAMIEMQDQAIEEKVRIQQDMLDKEKQLLDVQKEALAIKQQEMLEQQSQQQQLLEAQTRALVETQKEESMRQIQQPVPPPMMAVPVPPPVAAPVAPPVVQPAGMAVAPPAMVAPTGPPPSNPPMSAPPAMGLPPTVPQAMQVIPPQQGAMTVPPTAIGGPPTGATPVPPPSGIPSGMGGPPVAPPTQPVIGGPPLMVQQPPMSTASTGGPPLQPARPPPPVRTIAPVAPPVSVAPQRLMPTGPPPSRPTGPPPSAPPPVVIPRGPPPGMNPPESLSGPPPGGPPMSMPAGPPMRGPPGSVPGGPPSSRMPQNLMELHTEDPQQPRGGPPPSQMGNRPGGHGQGMEIPKPEVKLPHALEKVLAFKGERARDVGVKPEDIEAVERGEIEHSDAPIRRLSAPTTNQMSLQNYDYDDEDDDASVAKTKKESKNKRRKKKKKRSRQKRLEEAEMERQQRMEDASEDTKDEDVQIEYVSDTVDIVDPVFYQFKKIFETFKITEPEKTDASETPAVQEKKAPEKKEKDSEDDSESEEEEEKPDPSKMSKKKLKKMSRLSVAELKQLVSRPDVVEMHDVTARDPKLLVHLKATRNTVPVPRHWCFKRKYLQGKRGIEKPPFDLPDFIKATGIMEMRQALQDKEEAKSMKQKMRERVRPKMGKIDIDYQKLHDAFFRWQTKPKMTIHGDLYYEGKEFETRLKEKKPGNISDDLRTALGMPLGDGSEKIPPPWLIAMQRYGPPPSYPNLRIQGLNAPIPEGCSFGYHAGGWGKPPVDETGKPLYGDVFGVKNAELGLPIHEEKIEKTFWGELESESESEESSEEESEEETPADQTGLITPADTGLVTPSGIGSVPVGMETPDMIEFRKQRIEDAMDQGGNTPALYQVLPEKKAAVGTAMMGSAHVYDITAVANAPVRKPGVGADAEGVEVALNPEELDLDNAAMQAKYDETMREQQSHLQKEDLSDMVAEHAAKASKKRKRQQVDASKSAKKYKDFKF